MPPSLGQKLKHAREQLGLSLADVAHRTRIPVPRLQDMEEDHYNTFGSLTYARSFLQTYAGFLGVDANPVTDHMNPTPLGGARDYRYLTESLGRWIGFDADPTLMPDARPVRSTRVSTIVAAVFAVVLIAGVLWAKAYFSDHKSTALETRPVPRAEIVRDSAEGGEEVRPAVPTRAAGPENVPIRRALPVDDHPTAKAKK